MPTRTISYGKCFICGQTFAKNTIGRHLAKCVPAHDTSGHQKRLYHLSIEGKDRPEYWLHIEIPADHTLSQLDGFLRAIWLECCGHLSAFTIHGVSYDSNADEEEDFALPFPGLGFEPFGSRASMDVPLSQVLSPGDRFRHEYDFGTTTELALKVVSERKGQAPAGGKGVRILARNYAPVIPCSACGERAGWLYYEDYAPYCDSHAEDHPEWPDSFLPLVNSPRTGDCGYDGTYYEALVFEETAPPVGE
ncbi:MAG: plasmid pRiA4b ORF-3 family protein [Caldilineales bacterium]|nr:plasmid pRiA4b ORF-3 family protein [Caldilineales bacterium]